MTNPFPTLQQIAPDRWEGDSRIIQVKQTPIGYRVKIGAQEHSVKTTSEVQKLIDSVPPVTGPFVPIPQRQIVWGSANGFHERTVNFAPKKNSYY